MMTPDKTLKILDEFVEFYSSKKIFQFLHLPVQSGDDEILKKMNRHYTVEDFKKIVASIRQKNPSLTLSTDFICGFPGETEENFERSLRLIEEIRPDIVNITKFYPRPKTIVWGKKELGTAEIKRRTRKMATLASKISFEKNLEWISWIGEIIVDEIGQANSMIGRNFAYKPIVIKNGVETLGKYFRVTIKKAFSKYLEGEIAA
jgi:tRNA A37 methylthiotransferase MiaB